MNRVNCKFSIPSLRDTSTPDEPVTVRPYNHAVHPVPPQGFGVRRATPADAEPIADLVRRFELEFEGESELTADELLHDWREYDLATGTWLVESGGGTPAAYATLRFSDGVYEADGYVHPAYAGHGLGGYLLDAVEHAARIAEIRGTVLRTAVAGRDASARRLLGEHGYTAARHFWRMLIDLAERPGPPRWPEGIRVAGVAGREREFHAAKEEAFTDHWGNVPEAFEDWRERRAARPDHDPELSFAAVAGDTIAGVAECSLRYGGGWVNALGVRPGWRRRGLGEALLRHSLCEFAARGLELVQLGVDPANPTGATSLYEKVGMHVKLEFVVYEKPL